MYSAFEYARRPAAAPSEAGGRAAGPRTRALSLVRRVFSASARRGTAALSGIISGTRPTALPVGRVPLSEISSAARVAAAASRSAASRAARLAELVTEALPGLSFAGLGSHEPQAGGPMIDRAGNATERSGRPRIILSGRIGAHCVGIQWEVDGSLSARGDRRKVRGYPDRCVGTPVLVCGCGPAPMCVVVDVSARGSVSLGGVFGRAPRIRMGAPCREALWQEGLYFGGSQRRAPRTGRLSTRRPVRGAWSVPMSVCWKPEERRCSNGPKPT